MSLEDQLTVEQLQDKIETEYLTAIQLIHTISTELQILKHATSPGGEFEANVLENAELMSKLIEMGQLTLSDLKPRNTGINVNANRQGSSAEQELEYKECQLSSIKSTSYKTSKSYTIRGY